MGQGRELYDERRKIVKSLGRGGHIEVWARMALDEAEEILKAAAAEESSTKKAARAPAPVPRPRVTKQGLDQLLEDYGEREQRLDPRLTHAAAMEKVLKSDEGQRLQKTLVEKMRLDAERQLAGEAPRGDEDQPDDVELTQRMRLAKEKKAIARDSIRRMGGWLGKKMLDRLDYIPDK